MSSKNFIFTAFLCFASTLFGQTNLDSLWNVANTTTDPLLKVDALNDIAYYLRFSNPDSTLIIAEQSEALARANNYALGIGDAKMRLAIGHTNLGNYYRSLQLFLEAHTIFEESDEKVRVASSLNNIGRLYNFIGDQERALEYYEKSSVRFNELEDVREGNILNNIGFIHKQNGNYGTSLKYLRRAWKSADVESDAVRALYPIYNIGSVYMLMNELDSAEIYLDSAAQLSRQLRNQYILSLTKIDQGQMYLKINDVDAAHDAFKEAYDVALTAGMRSELKDASRYLSIVYENQNRLREALQFQKIYQSTSDSLFNQDLARRIALQEAEYEYQQLQIKQEIEQEKQKILQQTKLENAIRTRNSLIVGFIGMTLISYLFFRNFRRKRLANEELKFLNKQIEFQAKELKEANHEIIVMNNNLEKIVNKRTKELKLRNKQLKEYLSSNSHIVRAPLARILGLVDLYDPDDASNLPFINESLQESATELDNALRNINEKLSDEHDT